MFPNLCCFTLTHILAYTEKHWSVAFWVMYYYHNTCYLCSQAHERKNYLLFSSWHMLFNTFASKRANIQLWQKFILQRPLQRSRSHKKELRALNKFCQKSREGAEPGLEAGSCWHCHLQWARIPKGASFLFMLSHLLDPKTDIKIRQLLPLPTPTLQVPLNLMAGPSTSVCYTATLKAAQGSGLVEAGLSSRDWAATRLVLFVSFTNSGQGSKLHRRKWSTTIISFIYQNNSALKTDTVSAYPVTT